MFRSKAKAKVYYTSCLQDGFITNPLWYQQQARSNRWTLSHLRSQDQCGFRYWTSFSKSNGARIIMGHKTATPAKATYGVKETSGKGWENLLLAKGCETRECGKFPVCLRTAREYEANEWSEQCDFVSLCKTRIKVRIANEEWKDWSSETQ